MRVTTLTLFTN